MIVPVRPLGIRHLTNDELPCGDLVADVLELPLACVFLSFVSRVCHRLSIDRERGFLKHRCVPPKYEKAAMI